MDQAIARLTDQCMKSSGYASGRTAQDGLPLDPIEQARKFGFGISLDTSEPLIGSDGHDRTYVETMLKNHQTCTNSAVSVVSSAVGNVTKGFPEEVRDELNLLVAEQHPELLKADADWAACMAIRKIDLAKPGRAAFRLVLFDEWAVVDPSSRSAVEAFQTREISLALADVECYRSTIGLREAEVLKRLDSILLAANFVLSDPFNSLDWQA
jgi:hypothetical protein